MTNNILIYDSDCGICSQVAGFLKKIDAKSKLTFIPNFESDGLLEQFNIQKSITERTIIFIKLSENKYFLRSEGVMEVLKTQHGIYSLVGKVFGNKLFYYMFNPIYDLIAKNRAKISAFLGLNACKI